LLASVLTLLCSSNLRCHFCRKVVGTLFDALAHHKHRECFDRGARGLQHLLNALLVVLHERLIEQRHFLQVFLHAAIHHLGDDFSRLA